MRITIVGGCVTAQRNLTPEEHYHQRLHAALAASGATPALALVRYERLATCLPKVLAQERSVPSDWLIFHLRSEPLLRLTKLIYRYHGPNHRYARLVLNLPYHAGAEQHEPLADHSPRPAPDFCQPARPRFFAELNGWLGRWLGNERRAVRQYTALVAALHALCHAGGPRLLLVGPVERPASPFENALAHHLDGHFTAWAQAQRLPYVRLLGETGADSHSFLGPNRVHLSAAGHARLAERLLAALGAS